jgi:anti-anti-sigma regulatory factor
MIYIKEIPEGRNSVIIQIDGSLESESFGVFKEVCERNLSKKKKVTLNLQNLFYISREGMEYLEEIKRRVVIVGS